MSQQELLKLVVTRLEAARSHLDALAARLGVTMLLGRLRAEAEPVE